MLLFCVYYLLFLMFCFVVWFMFRVVLLRWPMEFCTYLCPFVRKVIASLVGRSGEAFGNMLLRSMSLDIGDGEGIVVALVGSSPETPPQVGMGWIGVAVPIFPFIPPNHNEFAIGVVVDRWDPSLCNLHQGKEFGGGRRLDHIW